MSRSLNRVMLIGNLGRDPEHRELDNGQSVTSFSIATTDSWTDKKGEKQERTEWHNIVAWGKLAEICAEYLKKGSKVYIEGSLKTEQYEKDGVTRYATKIVAREMMMLDGRREGAPAERAPAPQSSGGASASTDFEDDIPFAQHEWRTIA